MIILKVIFEGAPSIFNMTAGESMPHISLLFAWVLKLKELHLRSCLTSKHMKNSYPEVRASMV